MESGINPTSLLLSWVDFASEGLNIPKEQVFSKDMPTLMRDARVRLVKFARIFVEAELAAKEKDKMSVEACTCENARLDYEFVYTHLSSAKLNTEGFHSILDEFRNLRTKQD